jgi:subtilisin family serine protease
VRDFRFHLIMLLLLILLCCPAAEAAILSPELEQAMSQAQSQELPILIRVHGKPGLEAFKNLPMKMKRSAIAAALRDAANRNILPLENSFANSGGRDFKMLWIIHGMALKARPEVIRRLAAIPLIKSIELDCIVNAPPPPPPASFNPEWNLLSIGIPDVWNLGYRGEGVVIATMDTGVDINHPDLASKYRGGTNSWLDPYGEHATPFDASGHGTQVMGVLVGGSAGGTSIGVAPDARWIAAKVFSDTGQTSYSKIHLCFQWLLDPDGDPNTLDAPDVVNVSWGLNNVNTCNSEFSPDVAALTAANIGVVMAAGNSGPLPSSSISPANLPGALAVGAVDSNNTIALFSSRGPNACDGSVYPHLTAPGVGIRTSHLTYGTFLDSYITASGTSIATPHAAGALALLVGAFPSLPVDQLEAALLASASDLGVEGPDNNYGWGIINQGNAFNVLSSQVSEISSTPDFQDYGEVEVGRSLTQRFSIRNESENRVMIGRATVTPGSSSEFAITKDHCSKKKLAASQTCTVEVSFTPASEGLKSSSLLIPYKTSTEEGTLDVALSGTGIRMVRLSIIKAGPGTGTITGAPGEIDCGTTCTAKYKAGTIVTLQATPDPGSGFGGWSGDYSGTEPAFSLQLSENTSVVATFYSSNTITLITPNGGESWSVGGTQIIQWTYTGDPGNFVRLELYKGNVRYSMIAPRTALGSGGAGLYSWRIPPRVTRGSNYKIRIVTTGDSSLADLSDNSFQIVK